MKPRLLDLFCGAGGAAAGYQRAGFYVVGIDVAPQPNYRGDEFMQAEAIGWLRHAVGTGDIYEVDAIHASPPCQAYSLITRNKGTAAGFPDLIASTRALLHASGLPYVIENVVGAPLENPIMLCGSALGLGASGMDLHRHRLFECSFPAMGLACNRHHGLSMGVYGNGTNAWHQEKLGRNLTVAEMREAMEIDWMPRSSLNQAIPPAMTEFVGHYLMVELKARAKAAA